MRGFQITFFVLAVMAFGGALLTVGTFTAAILWQAGVALGLLAIGSVLIWPQRPDWTRPGHCVHCGYDLTGDTTGRCPECGKEIVWRDSSAHSREPE